MSYTYDYPRPGLTADCVVFGLAEEGPLQVLLIQRARYPFEGCWAVPGGFVEEGETLLEAARRELAEESGLADLPMSQFYTFGRPGRDPRGWVVTVAHWTVVRTDQVRPCAGDDAAHVRWFPLGNLPRLAFDHDEMLHRAVDALRLSLCNASRDELPFSPGVNSTNLQAAIAPRSLNPEP
ncbi:MAG: NUDIX hydrolase [Planctomycetaceae bacterium]|nr:NUDIX hydrolase [Planctomycetaceae bacterium]